jgi:hypothetical protein
MAAVASFMSVDVPGDDKTNLEPLVGGWTWQSLVTSLWEQIVAVGLITNLLRLFGTRRREGGPIMSSAGVSTYTVYIIHPIVLISLALALRDLPVPSLVKFLVTVPIAVILLFASAHYIRQMPVLRHVL